MIVPGMISPAPIVWREVGMRARAPFFGTCSVTRRNCELEQTVFIFCSRFAACFVFLLNTEPSGSYFAFSDTHVKTKQKRRQHAE